MMRGDIDTCNHILTIFYYFWRCIHPYCAYIESYLPLPWYAASFCLILVSNLIVIIILFIRVLEECRQARGGMECSLYNAEKRKKPLTCTAKVGFSHFKYTIGANLFGFFFPSPHFPSLHIAEQSDDLTSAFAATRQEKATASRLSDPLGSSPPSRDQESKSWQPPQLQQPGRARE